MQQMDTAGGQSHVSHVWYLLQVQTYLVVPLATNLATVGGHAT